VPRRAPCGRTLADEVPHLRRDDLVHDAVVHRVPCIERGVLAHQVEEDCGGEAGLLGDEADEPVLRHLHASQPLLEELPTLSFDAFLVVHDLLQIADGDLTLESDEGSHLVEEEGGVRHGQSLVSEEGEDDGRRADVVGQGHDATPLDGRRELREELEASSRGADVDAIWRICLAEILQQVDDGLGANPSVEGDELRTFFNFDPHFRYLRVGLYTLRGENSRFDPLSRTFVYIKFFVFCQVYKIQKPLNSAVFVNLFF
jgi:hypothetical protein